MRPETVIRAGSVSPLSHEPMGTAGSDLATLMAQGLPEPDWTVRGDLVLRDVEQVLREAAARAGRATAATTSEPGSIDQ